MSKMRIYELAKQIGKDSKEVVALLREHGVEVKGHMSSITEEEADYVRSKFSAGMVKPKEISNGVEKAALKKEDSKNEDTKKEAAKKEDSKKEVSKKPGKETLKEPKKETLKEDDREPLKDASKEALKDNSKETKKPSGNKRGKAKKDAQGKKDEIKKEEAKKEEIKEVKKEVKKEEIKRAESGKAGHEREASPKKEEAGREVYEKRSDAVRDSSKKEAAKKDNARQNVQNQEGRRKENYKKDNKNTNNKQGDSNRENNSRDNSRDNNHKDNGHKDNNRKNDGAGKAGGQKNQKNNSGQKNDREKHITKVFNPQNSGSGKNKNNNNKNGKNSASGSQSRPQTKQEPKEEEIKVITIPEIITIKELADKMKIQASILVKKLFLQGQIVTINNEIDFDQAEAIAMDYDIIAEKAEKVDVIEEMLKENEEDESKMVKRPPVVCVMGHVDHGKTSLLDAIRNTNVISGEAGGITQHIGAYTVECGGENITFLDTPGHEAFTAMRMRGAQATDIAILVVAADDGVMPQTVEAISHAKAAGISIIVAVNKIDKPSANVEKVKQELVEYGLVAEDWGGDTIFVPVSAHTGEGLPQLLEMVLLTAEMQELKANPNRNARGIVIEAKLDKGKGSVATVLVQKGTLRVGDNLAAGACYGRVRAMVDDKGEKVKEAGPSTPVEILGLNNVPNAGDVFLVKENEKEARNFADTFISQDREKLIEGSRAKSKMSLDDLFTQIQAGDVKELNIIVKADVQGSVEAVRQSLVKLSNDEVVVKIIHGGVGAINESDVSLASASNAIIIGFNVRPDNQAKDTAERENVDVRLYRVIYQAIEDVEAAMKGMLDPVYEEKVIGHGEVRQLFKASGVGTIAGSYVMDGVFQRGCSVRITREGKQIFEGGLASLKRFKDDVKEVKAGYECGLVFEGFNDLQELDQVEAYIMVEVPR